MVSVVDIKPDEHHFEDAGFRRPEQPDASCHVSTATKHAMHQRGENGAADHHLEDKKAARAEVAPELQRVVHMHGPGLQIALEPARALLDPGAECARALLHTVDDGMIAGAQPHARDAECRDRRLR